MANSLKLIYKWVPPDSGMADPDQEVEYVYNYENKNQDSDIDELSDRPKNQVINA